MKLILHGWRALSNHENYKRLRIGSGSQFRPGIGVKANFFESNNLTL
jgi:hypothetical protein